MIKENTFLINNDFEKKKCKEAIDKLNIEDNYCVFINKTDKIKTQQQCAFFHSLLESFVKTGQESGLGGVLDNNIGWWKYRIKKVANFYDTTKGCIFTKERSKEINEKLKTLPKDIQEDIIKAMTMNVKSISQATTKELNILINNLIIQIVLNLPQEVIKTNEFISKTICETYNDLLNNNYSEDKEKQEMLFIFQDKLKFKQKNIGIEVYYVLI